MAGIPTNNIFQPGSISQPAANRQLISDLQILERHYYKMFVEKYGAQNWTTWLSTFSTMERVGGKEFYHYESLGKLMLHVANKTAVTAPAAGATVTVTIQVADHWDSGTLSAIRVGETVKTTSSGIEGKVLTVDKTTPSAHSMTIRPLRADQAFVSAGSANLLAGEIIKLMSNSEAGEASSNINPQMPVNEKITNYCTEIRDDWTATDLAEMEEVEYDISAVAGLSAGINRDGQSAYTYKGLTNANIRFLNNVDLKLEFGGLQTNTGLNPAATGTKGFVPEVVARGNPIAYSVGSLDLSVIHAVTAQMDVYGSPMQNQWLMDIKQRQEFDDALFALYPAGAFVYGNGAASEDASVNYGFQNFRIDNYLLQAGKNPIFNTEVLYGVTPDVDQYRNFGIIIPQGSKSVRYSNGGGNENMGRIPNVTVMYEEPRGGGSIANGIKVWEYGGAAKENMTAKMDHTVSMITYKGIRLMQASQFFTVSGS